MTSGTRTPCTSVDDVLALRHDWRGTTLVTLHNFSAQPRTVRFSTGATRDDVLVELFGRRPSRKLADGRHSVRLEPYGWRWMRTGQADETLLREALTMEGGEVTG